MARKYNKAHVGARRAGDGKRAGVLSPPDVQEHERTRSVIGNGGRARRAGDGKRGEGRPAGVLPGVPARAVSVAGTPGRKHHYRFGHIDIPMLTITLLILLFGLVMLFSASYPSGYLRRWGDSYSFIRDQLEYVVLGVVGLVVATMVDYNILKKFAWPLAVVTLVLLVVVLFMTPKNGAQRWIWINYETEQGFQPSEIAKFALILVFAKMIAAHQSRIRSFKYGFMPFMVVLGGMALLLIQEPHLSCTILVIGIGLSMVFAGGTSLRWFALAAVIVVGAVVLAATQFPELIPEYAYERVNTWLDPFTADPDDAHQTIQSLIAIGSGGLTGKGIGRSVQKFLHLPEVYNDYIYAVVCEELGFIGAMAVVVLFLVFLARGIFIALRARDKFGSMLVLGITIQVALQAFLHIAVNTNAIPSTGISLPFFSYGGTSLVMLMAQMGVVLSVSRKCDLRLRRKREEAPEAPPGENAGAPPGAREAVG